MLTDHDELGAWLRLLATPGIGSESARKLLAAFGPPPAIWAQSPSAWQAVVGARTAQAMRLEPEGWRVLHQATWDWLQNDPAHRAIVTLGDADYPAPLLQTADPPCLLYAMGRTDQLPQLQATRALAVVGSRNPTPQGRLNAQAFAKSLVQSGLTVVSGLALGVDGAAHEGALEGAAPGQLVFAGVLEPGSQPLVCRQLRCRPEGAVRLQVSAVARSAMPHDPAGTPLLHAQRAQGRCDLERGRLTCGVRGDDGEGWRVEANL